MILVKAAADYSLDVDLTLFYCMIWSLLLFIRTIIFLENNAYYVILALNTEFCCSLLKTIILVNMCKLQIYNILWIMNQKLSFVDFYEGLPLILTNSHT